MNLKIWEIYQIREGRSWLQNENTRKWSSVPIQHEVMEIMAHFVQRQIVENIQTKMYYCLITDGTIDVASLEHFTLCLRLCRPRNYGKWRNVHGFNVYIILVKFYLQLLNILIRLVFDRLRGHCFDGHHRSRLKDPYCTLAFVEYEKLIIIAFVEQRLKNKIVRSDYRELLKLTRLFLRGNTVGNKKIEIHPPGAMHQARWVARTICCLKILVY